MIIKKGQMLLLSSGDFDDYGLDHLVRALVDFDVTDVFTRFRNSGVFYKVLEPDPGRKVNVLLDYPERFLAWGVQEGLFVVLREGGEVLELWLSEGTVDELDVIVKAVTVERNEDFYSFRTKPPMK
jgi:hypothetical protein